MKTFLIAIAILFFSSVAMADPFLICDDPLTDQAVTGYECFQDGVSLGPTPAPLHYDLAGVTPGAYNFTCVAINAWGVSQPSDPYRSPQTIAPPSNINMEP